MHDVSTSDGRTILFVSHNMSALTQLCEHGILLEDGQVKTTGPVKDVIRTYLKSKLNQNTAQARFPADPSKPCQYVSAEILHSDGELGSDFSCDEPVTIRLQFEIKEPIPTACSWRFLSRISMEHRSFSPMFAIWIQQSLIGSMWVFIRLQSAFPPACSRPIPIS